MLYLLYSYYTTSTVTVFHSGSATVRLGLFDTVVDVIRTVARAGARVEMHTGVYLIYAVCLFPWLTELISVQRCACV